MVVSRQVVEMGEGEDRAFFVVFFPDSDLKIGEHCLSITSANGQITRINFN